MCFDFKLPAIVIGYGAIFGGPPGGVLDPSNSKTYELTENVLKYFNNTFGDMIHMGGDEVEYKCFLNNPKID